MTDRKGEHACFFCEKNIAENGGVDPCGLVLHANVDRKMKKRQSQRFYCHIDCFKKSGAFGGTGIYHPIFNEDT